MMTLQEWIDSHPEELIAGIEQLYVDLGEVDEEVNPTMVVAPAIEELQDELYQAYVDANS